MKSIPRGMERRIVPVLLSEGLLDEKNLGRARIHAEQKGIPLTQALTDLGMINEEDMVCAFGTALGTTCITLKGLSLDEELLSLVPQRICQQHQVLPISRAGDTLTVAMTNPLDVTAIDSVRKTSGLEVVPVVARPQEMREVLEQFFRSEDSIEDVARRLDGMFQGQGTVDTVELAEDVNEDSPPVVRLVNRTISDAVKERASDIHIEPSEEKVMVRIRVDGVLREMLTVPEAAARALVSRIKVMAGLDIAERRLPQDGRISFGRFDRNFPLIDLRVSTLPTVNGEKVVMRIINRGDLKKGLESLGMTPKVLETYRGAIHAPYGMILHVGPTGSGKTTTLYAALSEVVRPGINIQTVEDPVEYRLPGVSQTQVHSDIGLTFARALRSFLRQDPDVIMVGEMRDLETASTAVEAALTGHLVLSTLHTNDAVGTITRLVEMGIEPFLVGSGLILVCAQRLMRRLCECKEEIALTQAHMSAFQRGALKQAPETVFKAGGCDQCGNTGFSGRIGIHELLVMNDDIRTLVVRGADEPGILESAKRSGMLTLYQDAMRKVALGITSLEEALRVVR